MFNTQVLLSSLFRRLTGRRLLFRVTSSLNQRWPSLGSNYSNAAAVCCITSLNEPRHEKNTKGDGDDRTPYCLAFAAVFRRIFSRSTIRTWDSRSIHAIRDGMPHFSVSVNTSKCDGIRRLSRTTCGAASVRTIDFPPLSDAVVALFRNGRMKWK